MAGVFAQEAPPNVEIPGRRQPRERPEVVAEVSLVVVAGATSELGPVDRSGGVDRTETVEADRTGETEIERRYRYFRAVKVYDRAQVRPSDGAQPVDLRPPGEPLTGDSHAHLLAPLCALAQSLGYRVTARELDPDGAQGWGDPVTREIVVNSQRPANARVRILVHEIAHAHPAGKLDYNHFSRQQAEVLVDTVTYGETRTRTGDTTIFRRGNEPLAPVPMCLHFNGFSSAWAR